MNIDGNEGNEGDTPLGMHLARRTSAINLSAVPMQDKTAFRYSVVYILYRMRAGEVPRYVTFGTLDEAKQFSYEIRRFATFNEIFRLDKDEEMNECLAVEAYRDSGNVNK